MMTIVSIVVFAGALVTAIAVIALAVGPHGSRILRVAAGHADRSFAPLEQLVRAERRIAIRRRASLPAPVRRLREVA
jgi:hypothetical protein